jgi:hypothetical protein
MAEQRTPGSGDPSPAQEHGSQGRDTTQEGRAPVTETTRQVGETASQSDAQGCQQLEGGEQSLEEHIRAKRAGKPVVAGGPHPTSYGEEMWKESTYSRPFPLPFTAP